MTMTTSRIRKAAASVQSLPKRSKSGTFKLIPYLKRKQKEIDRAMAKALPHKHDLIGDLYEAMRHSMFSGGKRLRPVLILAAAEACGKPSDGLMNAALAMECIHTYSLIHDDLPAMDNDDLRRGQPTCHVAFDEPTAILAGDGLLTYAFELMAMIRTSSSRGQRRLLEAIHLLAHAAGMNGMVGGQMADLVCEKQVIDLPTLEYIHTHKTGHLISAACRMGALLGGARDSQVKALTVYGEALGLAFQIADDILNVVGDQARLGKQTGTDQARGKATYPALLGLEASQEHARALMLRALTALKPLGPEAEPLRALAHYVIEREV